MLKKRISIFSVALACTLATATFAHAEGVSQENVHIKGIGSHTGNIFYLYLEEGFTKPCAYSVVYCPQTDRSCINYYPIAITAKMLNKPLRKLSYNFNQNGNNLCYISLLSVE